MFVYKPACVRTKVHTFTHTTNTKRLTQTHIYVYTYTYACVCVSATLAALPSPAQRPSLLPLIIFGFATGRTVLIKLCQQWH